MNSAKVIFIKSSILIGAFLVTAYIAYRTELINIDSWITFFSILLYLAEIHTLLQFYGMLYALWPRRYKTYKKLNLNKNLQIHLFICACGEPLDVIQQTILAAKITVDAYVRLVHPHIRPEIIVLNDGYTANKDNWQDIQTLCYALDVKHILRTVPGGFKAGNINNGLKQTQTNDPHNTIDIVLDADCAAKEELLLELTKPFTDTSVDYVQSPQYYQNNDTWVAQASSDHQNFFFNSLCPAKGIDNALFLCGTNFAIRRSALNAVGGLDTRFIAEDYATSITLHTRGKKGVYIPKVLAIGIGPSTLGAYFTQQRRWAKGTLDASIEHIKDLTFGSLTPKQKIHYFLSATFYLIGLRTIILLLAPLFYLIFGVALVKATQLQYLLSIYIPFLCFSYLSYVLLFKHPVKSLVLQMITFPVYTLSLVSSLFKKNLHFMVTSKKQETESIFRVYSIHLMILFLFAGVVIDNYLFTMHKHYADFVNYYWALYSAGILGLGLGFIMIEHVKQIAIIQKMQTVLALLSTPFRLPRLAYLGIAGAICMLMFMKTVSMQTLAVASTQVWTSVIPSTAQSAYETVRIPTKGAYYGYYFGSLDNHPANSKVSLFAQEHPSLVMYFQDWGNENGFDTAFNEQLSEKNVIPIITWEPWNAQTDKATMQTKYTPQAIANGRYDDFIRSWAQAAAAYKKPLFLRFAHEMNGNWYPWGTVNGNTPEDYIAMWRHVHDIFTQEGAKNVLWVYAPNNVDVTNSSQSILDYYPGNEYVDWVGYSGFNWGLSGTNSAWKSFADLSQPAYEILAMFNKPIMAAETSSVSSGGDKNAWLDTTLTKDIPLLPKIKAVVLYDKNYNQADFSLETNKSTNDLIQKDIINNTFYLKRPILKDIE